MTKEQPPTRPWRNLKVRAFLMSGALIVGHAAHVDDTTDDPEIAALHSSPAYDVRLWAPTLAQLTPSGINLSPLAFVDEYLDVSLKNIVGETPVTDTLLAAYENFAERFARDGFRTRPLAFPAFVPATPETPSPAMTRAIVLGLTFSLGITQGRASAHQLLRTGRGAELTLDANGLALCGAYLVCSWPELINCGELKHILDAMRIAEQDRVRYCIVCAGPQAAMEGHLGDLSDLQRSALADILSADNLQTCSIFWVGDVLQVPGASS